MCGIAGLADIYSPDPEEARPILHEMLKALRHRGPDGEGLWLKPVRKALVGLANRRLAIIDLSAGGHQPMTTPDGRFVLTYNGEVYNYRELRNELESKGYRFLSQSDTEVVLQALAVWGVEALRRFNGMWALAFLDTVKGSLILARDRFGVKPLYVHHGKTRVVFASEIKAICVAYKERFRVNPVAVASFLGQFLLDAHAETFFAGVHQVPPGHWVHIDISGDNIQISEPQCFWSIPREPIEARSEEYLAEHIRETFLDAVRLRLRSDVPVGVLLSGGVDSSSIVAGVSALNPPDPPRIFSVVSDDPRTSEEPFIDTVASYLRLPVEKVRLTPSPEQAFSAWELATYYNDEPLTGFSYVALFLLMEQTRKKGVTVLLSGQGGDETLCGYLKYRVFALQSLLRGKRLVEAGKALWHLVAPGSPFLADFQLGEALRYLPSPLRSSVVPSILGPALQGVPWELPLGLNGASITDRQIADITTYSIPALTHYEDRMSSAFAREVRLPFLDYRLVSLLVPLETHWKLRYGWTKWIFRKAIEPLLPHSIVWRKDKKGFTTPVGLWLRGAWRQKITSLIEDTEMLSARWGLVNQQRLLRLYRLYCRGWPGLSEKHVFAPLALEIWCRQFSYCLRKP